MKYKILIIHFSIFDYIMKTKYRNLAIFTFCLSLLLIGNLQNDFILELFIYNFIFLVNFAKEKKGLVCIGVGIVHGEWLGKHRHLC